VSQGILRTQKFTNQKKKAMRENGHRKFKKPKRQRCFSPVESPILFKDKFVSADTNQSPQIHLDLEQTVTEYYSFPRSKVLNGQEKRMMHLPCESSPLISVVPRSTPMLLCRPITTTQTNHSKDINIFKTLDYTCDQGIM
jgi:hypothetical protein